MHLAWLVGQATGGNRSLILVGFFFFFSSYSNEILPLGKRGSRLRKDVTYLSMELC